MTLCYFKLQRLLFMVAVLWMFLGANVAWGAMVDKIYIPSEADGSVNIHSNYKNNTDTCASCHATHTALGESLLQWSSVSETCFACHDGTVSTTYDVVNGRFYDFQKDEYYPTSGGNFSIEGDKNVSMHNVSGMVRISAAPGGSNEGIDSKFRKAGDPDYLKNAVIISWDLPFTCASCHNPHAAGGNARLLQPDPNGYAQRHPLEKARALALNSDNLEWSVYPDINGDGDPDKYWNGHSVKGYSIVVSYPYTRKIKVYRRPRTGGNYEELGNYTIDQSTGVTVFRFSNDPSKYGDQKDYYNIYVDGLPGVTVGMRIKNYLRFGETVEYKYGINIFCGSCHEDYNTAKRAFFKGDEYSSYFPQFADQQGYFSGSGGKYEVIEKKDGKSGEYSEAYRHQVGMVWNYQTPGLKFERDPWDPDRSIIGLKEGNFIVDCLTCHVAHGVSKEYWERTIGTGENSSNSDIEWPLGLFENNELEELQSSSALKRMPNMGVCEACHKKGEDAVQYSVNEEKD